MILDRKGRERRVLSFFVPEKLSNPLDFAGMMYYNYTIYLYA